MSNLLIVNTQSFGDIILSSHIGRLAKKYIPNFKIHLYVNPDLTLTTAETSKEAQYNMLDILAMQENIESVGFVYDTQILPIKGKNLKPTFEDTDFILIQGWSSELGIVKSQLKPFYDLYEIKDPIDTETKFSVGVEKQLPSKKTIAIAGDLDFLRKWHNEVEYKKFIEQITNPKYNIDIIRVGSDISSDLYLTQLQKVNNCHLVIAPMGSLIHIAAGLGVDTICTTSVFPEHYDCPEHYHTGYHKSIKVEFPLRCENFNCVKYKPYDHQASWGNPVVEYGNFWPATCKYTVNNRSCNFNVTADMLIKEFEVWYDRYN